MDERHPMYSYTENELAGKLTQLRDYVAQGVRYTPRVIEDWQVRLSLARDDGASQVSLDLLAEIVVLMALNRGDNR